MWKTLIRWWKIIKQYFSNCSIHGVRYLVNEQLSPLERLFWLIACLSCWYGCANMIKDVVRNYIYYPVALTTETMYVDWETPFPAIFLCVSTTRAIQNDYFKWNPGLLSNYSNPKLLQASTEDLLSAYDKMKLPCTELFAECTWNNMNFNCCTEFQELKKTGAGYCIGMNTFHLRKFRKPIVRFLVNRTVKYGDLIIDIQSNKKTKIFLATTLTAYVFNNLQLPTSGGIGKSEIRAKPGKLTRVEFTMEDTFNEDGVKKVAMEHRNCRFSHETRKTNMFDIYSSDSCYLEVIVERMLRFCGCVHFYYPVPWTARICNGTEMLCIINNKTHILSEEVIDEECLPDCEGTSLILNRLEPYGHKSVNDSFTRFHFTLLSHPTMRYRRYVVYDLLDVTVSIGSAVGLFMGASILSIFEIPYWLFIRRDKIQ